MTGKATWGVKRAGLSRAVFGVSAAAGVLYLAFRDRLPLYGLLLYLTIVGSIVVCSVLASRIRRAKR